MKYLDRINTPQDLKDLSIDELNALCGEIREFLIENVSKTGGHISANLGVVELTVGIHRVFDTSVDRLVFDVGHQSYVHKLLTGRKDGFENLRQFGGLSGFPKPAESVHDAFIAGHASNSVSVALGMARARTKLRQDYNVIALIGDGALSGGLSYEALDDAGESEEQLIVILNDNGMSIKESVGGVARHLSRLRIEPGYYNFKSMYRSAFKKMPGGERIHRFLHNIKASIKSRIYNSSSMFEEMGFEYLGPVDGHNIKDVITALKTAKKANHPVLVHMMTVKGKGCEYTEKDPERYHGVPGFDPVTGKLPKSGLKFSQVFGDKMVTLAHKDPAVIAVTAAMESGTGLTKFADEFPDRFYDTGIAEEHSVAMCAGMASQGLKPVFAVYSTFLQRGYDMLLHDVALTNAHVVFGVDRAGLVGEDGETHHGVYDVGYLNSVPHMEILCPASFKELQDMLEYAVLEAKGPAAVRYPRGGEGKYREGGIYPSKVLREGGDITIVSYGVNINDAADAAELLEKRGVSAEVVKLGIIKPADFSDIFASVRKTGRLMVVEECAAAGCVGARIAAALEENKVKLDSLILKNLGDGIVTAGKVPELKKLCGIDAEGLAKAVMEEIG
ncbi:MAG: 1-deoxy-D-xylulose-5-phosphate synthase [Oscillospiraceae bacterium]|nr:1-deoxy-D-xylulose-5-phosphate synthase [Oscillospiraceae bacterium]